MKKKVIIISLNFRRPELEKEFELIQEIIGKENLFPNDFIDQQEFSELILRKKKDSIKKIIQKNNIQNIIVSSEYYENAYNNREYHDLLFSDWNLKRIFISHTNGEEKFKQMKKEVEEKYPGCPFLFLSEISVKRGKDPIEIFKEVVLEHFK